MTENHLQTDVGLTAQPADDGAPTASPSAESLQPGARDLQEFVKAGEAFRFRKGEPGPALKTGEHSQLIRSGEYQGGHELLAACRAEIYAELGGDLSAVMRSMVDAFVELGAVRDYLGSRLAVEGPLTAKGYTRALLSAYLSVTDRQVRLAQLLGLERKAKRVPSLSELMVKDEEPGNAE